MIRLLFGVLLALAPIGPAFSAPAAPAKARPAVRLHLSSGTERHIRESHFPGGRWTRGKSLFFEKTDLAALLKAAQAVAPRRQANGRDKRVVDAGKPIGTDGRSGRPVSRYTVIAETTGLVITAYPGD